MKKFFLLIYLFLVGMSTACWAAPGKIRFSHITNNDGLPSNTIFSIVKDYKGYFWFGTKAGLVRYDGRTIVKYEYIYGNPNSLPGNLTQCIYEDSKKNLWVSTINGIAKYNRNNNNFEIINRKIFIKALIETRDGKIYAASQSGFKIFDKAKNNFVDFKSSEKAAITDFCNDVVEDKHGDIWVATSSGLYMINPRNNSMSLYRNDPHNKYSLISNRLIDLFLDKNNQLWIGTEDNGLCCFDRATETFHKVEGLSNKFIHCISGDEYGRLWIGTEWGLNIYSPADKTNKIYIHDITDKNSINDNAIYSICRDDNNNMLVGTFFGGINLSLKLYEQFNLYESGNTNKFLSGRAVQQIIGADNDNLWIATEDGGLNYFDSKNDRFTHFKNEKGKNSLSYNNVHSLLYDKDNELWVGTYLGGLNKFNIRNHQFTLYNKAKYAAFNVDNILALLQDRDGLIWIATTNGILTYNKQSNTFQQFKPGIFGAETVNVLLEDSKGAIWIGTRNLGVYKYIKKSNHLKNYSSNGDKSLSDKYINYIYEDYDKNIWFATHNGGLNVLNTKNDSITVYRISDGLPSNTVFALIQDNRKNLWISTNNGLSKYNIKKNTFTNFTTQEGLPNNQFNYNSVYKNKAGRLFFGTIDGLISFDPNKLEIKQTHSKIDITDFKVMGKNITPLYPNSPLRSSISETTEMVLTSEQAKFISFEFTLPTLVHSQNLNFAIKMMNFDKDWINIGNLRQVSFTNLPAGEYTFMVNATQNNSWTDNEIKSIKIKVLPPFWRSNLAFLMYLIIISVITYYTYQFILRRNNERRLIADEKLEKDRIKEINRLKLNFFTNISHELNTPLTLIITPIQNMLTQHVLSPELNDKMLLIKKNAERMQHLIEELILLGKIETDVEKVCIEEGYALRFILELGSRFKPWAESKNIHFSMDITVAKYPVYFDPTKLEKIVSNLLSNAFKYTDPEGEVKLSADYFLDNDIKMLRIKVIDTGRGIAKEDLSKIFENYYQIKKHEKNTGFGIGLNLVKQLLKAHKGTIEVQSEEGKGSQFTVIMTVDERSFSEDEKSTKKFDNQSINIYDYRSPDPVENEKQQNYFPVIEQKNTNLPYLLIVEDNQDLLEFLGSIFSNDYQLKLCSNGKEALDAALETIPDLIISDLMMPEMDGLELCKEIKSSIETCHIPFIILTAKVGEESIVEGYEYGADVYIKKPFNATVLLQQVTNILTTKANQRNYFRTNTDSALDSPQINSRDKKLLESINKLVLEHLAEEEYSIINLTKDLSISRTLLHTKLKGIVGLSATEYINKIKLKEGLRLLQEGNNISEVSYITGFTSPNYFSRCFKKVYGKSPRDFSKES